LHPDNPEPAGLHVCMHRARFVSFAFFPGFFILEIKIAEDDKNAFSRGIFRLKMPFLPFSDQKSGPGQLCL
jgi:hypothetical protein